jgi:general secretion pathway protein I
VNCARRAAEGFTLVEILVALAVLAIALTATARSLGAAIDTTAALRDRTLARWVAEDRLAELELGQEWPALDVKEGDADMGGHAFHWRQETGVTPAPRMRRVEVSVFLKGTDSTLSKMTGFLEQTAPQPGPPGSQTGSQPGQTGPQAVQTGPQTGMQPGPQTGPTR